MVNTEKIPRPEGPGSRPTVVGLGTGPKDVFLHLLAILTLYASAIAFIALIFQYINVLIPDLLETQRGFSLQSSYQAIRWSIASLVVIFPVYVFSSWYLNKS